MRWNIFSMMFSHKEKPVASDKQTDELARRIEHRLRQIELAVEALEAEQRLLDYRGDNKQE